MFYYSYFIDQYNTKRPTRAKCKELYNMLPVERGDIFGEDRYHIAAINEYLIPTEFNIILYAKLPLGENKFIDELNFDCGYITNNNISPEEFDRIVEEIRTFETRRNLYLMKAHAEGKTPKEYMGTSQFDSFDITSSNRNMMLNGASVIEEFAVPNYRVSESFLKEFYGGTYEEYANAINNNPDKVLYNFDLNTNVTSKEEWNTKIVNWINKNIFDLANIGFYAANFPDIIAFDSSFSDNTSLPLGTTVHRAYTIPSNQGGKISKFFSKFKK